MLYDGQYTYLIGYDTLGWEGARSPMGPVMWTYVLPDALGSVRQETDATGAVTAVRAWSPYGEEVGGSQNGLGYTGEWFDASVGLQYLRARWLDVGTGRFTQPDPWEGNSQQPGTLNGYTYVRGNPIALIDPTGMIERWWEDMLRNSHWREVLLDSAQRHNDQSVTNLDNRSFAAVLASVILIEGGNLGGASEGIKGTIGDFVGPLPEDIRIPIVNYVKFAEILFNRWLDIRFPPFMSVCQNIARDKIGYQTEGIVNINPDVRAKAAQYGITIYKDSDPFIQFNVEDPYFRADRTPDRSKYLRGQEQWVEYLAVSFEVVQREAQRINADISFYRSDDEWPESVRAFSQWHKSGIVRAFPYEDYPQARGAWYGKESLKLAEKTWADLHIQAQVDANHYYEAVKQHMRAAITGLDAP